MVKPIDDAFDLARFLDAQASTYLQALAELRAGRKQSHWSWFILPQVSGLGASAMSMRYAIRSLAEARAYLAHPVLGARLRECVAAMNRHAGMSASQILGDIDAQKFHACVTLFAQADASDRGFRAALDNFFAGVPHAATLTLLARPQGAATKA